MDNDKTNIISMEIKNILSRYGNEVVRERNKFFGIITDTIVGDENNISRRLIQKGIYSGLYETIIFSPVSQVEVEARKAVRILVDQEFMTEEAATDSVNILLGAIGVPLIYFRGSQRSMGADEITYCHQFSANQSTKNIGEFKRPLKISYEMASRWFYLGQKAYEAKDYTTAAFWYRIAAENGHYMSMSMMRRFSNTYGRVSLSTTSNPGYVFIGTEEKKPKWICRECYSASCEPQKPYFCIKCSKSNTIFSVESNEIYHI